LGDRCFSWTRISGAPVAYIKAISAAVRARLRERQQGDDNKQPRAELAKTELKRQNALDALVRFGKSAAMLPGAYRAA
jgi:hypothetical protein